MPTPPAQSRSVFTGREAELAELMDAFAEATAGRGSLVLVEGEPGIGKSRLADELASRARDLGHQVLWGRGWEDAGAPPYWPWVQVLRSLGRSSGPDELRRYLGSGAADVAQILPELRDMFTDIPSPRDTESDAARFQLFDSTATLLRSVGRARPLLVILDDLHAADTASLLLLRFLASQLADMHVLIVGTYRDVELAPDPGFGDTIAELQRERATRAIRVGGLPPPAVAALIAATAGLKPGDALVAIVSQATGGNPLFVGEAVRLLRAEGRLTRVADLDSLRVAVPAGVRAVIARRIGHLDRGVRRALDLGAVLGPEFSLEVLSRVGELGSDVAIDLVDQAVVAGLLLPVAGAAGRYRFSHDLVRETLYDELSAARRGRLHRRIGAVLEELGAARPGSRLPELAFHFAQAAQDRGAGASQDGDVGTVIGKAVDYAWRAGEEAARSRAFEEAARLYRMALSALDLDADASEQLRAELLIGLGDAQTRAADLDRARTTFLAAAEIARRTGEAQLLARAALGYGGRHQWARAGRDTHLIPLLREALVVVGAEDERLRVRLLTRLAGALRGLPDQRSESGELSHRATEIARSLKDPATLSYAIEGQFWATWWPENPEDRVKLGQEMRELASLLDDGERIAAAELMSVLSSAERGRMDEVRRDLQTLARTIDELRQPAFWLRSANLAWLALFDGKFELAEEMIRDEAKSDYRVTPAHDDVSARVIHRFLLRREQGRLGEEVESLRQAAIDFPWYPVHRAALVCAMIATGREAEARSTFAELARNDFVVMERDNEWLLGMALASEACALLGEANSAAVLYEQLRPFAGRHAMGFIEGSVGAVDRYLGLLASTLGQIDDAVQHLTAAIGSNDEMATRPWAAHCRHDLAVLLRRRGAPGDLERASELEADASQAARSLGMVLADAAETSGPPLPTSAAAPATNAAAALPSARAAARFQREGEYWTVEFGSEAIRLRDSKGMGYLAKLLRSPGTELHALDLASPGGPGRPGGAAPADFLRSEGLGGTGPTLDAEAKAAYAERLRDIRLELAEAEEWNDTERVTRLQEEERFLATEIAAAVGLGQRDRVVGSASERARVSVTRAIRSALDRISEQSEPLGEHLQATIRTGTYCSYVPDPRAPIEWGDV